jgi:hypothetical protein
MHACVRASAQDAGRCFTVPRQSCHPLMVHHRCVLVLAPLQYCLSLNTGKRPHVRFSTRCPSHPTHGGSRTRRASRPAQDPEQQRAAQQRAALAARPPGGVGGLPLAGAELQAAILQQRTQLRSVSAADAQAQQQQPDVARRGGGHAAGQPGGAAACGGGTAAAADSSLEAALRRGLERFHFSSSADGGSAANDTHDGNTDFIVAAMERGGRGG